MYRCLIIHYIKSTKHQGLKGLKFSVLSGLVKVTLIPNTHVKVMSK